MKTLKRNLTASLVLTLSLVASSLATTGASAHATSENGDATAAAVIAQQPQQYGALERGYRTGYSDGYQSGWRDAVERAPADYRGKEDYQRANRAYITAYGSLEDYRDGYQQGFEIGYDAGYQQRGFASEIPTGGVRRRGATASQTRSDQETRSGDERDDAQDSLGRSGERDGQDTESSSGVRSSSGGNSSSNNGRSSSSSSTGSRNSIPANTIMRIELLNRLSSDVSQRGDRFEARVVEPAEYAGAVVGGRVTGVQRAGRARGRSQIQLDFDQIRLADGDWMDFSAQVIEVVNTGDDEQGEVDPEGGVRGKSSTKDDVAKVGASAGIGAVIGAIAGGGKGAAIGAVIGGAAGTGGVMTQRGKEIRFERGQQLRIRTAGDSQVRD